MILHESTHYGSTVNLNVTAHAPVITPWAINRPVRNHAAVMCDSKQVRKALQVGRKVSNKVVSMGHER